MATGSGDGRAGSRWGRSSRPLRGPRFGPGPLAETFPEPLAPLEVGLWVEPLRRALAESLRLAGTAGDRRLARSPLVVVLDGRVALDLGLVDPASTRRSRLARLDPRLPLRRLAAAWRVGRLRAVLPDLASDLAARADADLGAIGTLAGLTDEALLNVLHRAGPALTALHGLEMLSGLVHLDEEPSLASRAVRAVVAGRDRGMGDEEIVGVDPVVLALCPPAVGGRPALPEVVSTAAGAGAATTEIGRLGPREGLRLRIRWVHELTARVAGELGRRLAHRGVLTAPEQVALLPVPELVAAVAGGALPDDLPARRRPEGPPLPTEFRFDPAGKPVAVTVPVAGGRGRPASPGHAVGRVHTGSDPEEGDILVVSWLDPRLAPCLASVGGLVCETGTTHSHLAIVAREWGIPAVVGLSGACDRFRAGTVVEVDGTRGEVREVAP